jgi:hypothetical protein
METFSKHIMAVAKLIAFRGPDQFRTAVSAGILSEIRKLVVSPQCLLLSCILLKLRLIDYDAPSTPGAGSFGSFKMDFVDG